MSSYRRPSTTLGSAPRRTVGRLLTGLAFLLTIAVCWLLFSPRSGLLTGYEQRRAALLVELASADAAARQQAAWRAAETADSLVLAEVSRLAFDDPVVQVREACVYVLGLTGGGEATSTLEQVLLLEADGWVRSTAWLALARAAPDRFRDLSMLHQPDDDDWERIGVASGRVWLGDADGLANLLDVSGSDNSWQKEVSQRFLRRTLRPALDALGLWPLELASADNWTPQQIILIRARVATATDLGPLLREQAERLERLDGLRGLLTRIEGARRRLVATLFTSKPG